MISPLLYKLAQEIDENKNEAIKKEESPKKEDSSAPKDKKEERAESKPIDSMAIMDFFASNYDVTDDQFRSFAEQNGFNVHEAKEVAYNLASAFMELIRGGKGYNLDIDSVDPQQLEWGMIIESEHSSIPAIQKKIALDHLAEDPQYYSNDIFQEELQKKYEEQNGENQASAGEEKQAAESCKTKKIMKKKSTMTKTSDGIPKSSGISKNSSFNPTQKSLSNAPPVLNPKTLSGLQRIVTSLKKRNITGR